MIDTESVKVYNQSQSSFLSYTEYEDTKPNIIIGVTPESAAPSDVLPVRPLKLFLMAAQDWCIADAYWNSNTIENIISERFFKIPDVECIFLSIENDLINVRTVINKYDKKIAKNIYTAEYDLLEIFKDYFFDFLIIYREDREIDDICPSESVIIFRR